MKFKRGDTFKFTILLNEIVDGEDQPLIVDVENIKCQVRKKDGTLVEELVVSLGAEDGEYIFASADTSNYPTEELEMDIQVTRDGEIGSTDTFKIEVIKDITRNEV